MNLANKEQLTLGSNIYVHQVNQIMDKENSEILQTGQQEIQKSAKRKREISSAIEIENSDHNDEGEHCSICMESWTNSGEHRIASLRCGHFFGYSCIEKWLKASTTCPNCNEKAQKGHIRIHYISSLKAIDTSERDRALAELDETKKKYKNLELEHNTLKMTLTLQMEEMAKVKSRLEGNSSAPLVALDASNNLHGKRCWLTYFKKIDLIGGHRNQNNTAHFCRVMTISKFHGVIVVSQPSFTVLAPGFGVRIINSIDMKPVHFISLHREPIRDLALSPDPLRSDYLLSASQDKSLKLSSITSCQILKTFNCGNEEVWSCCWSYDDPEVFFGGTKRGQVFIFETRSISMDEARKLDFPTSETKPIIGLEYVPKCQNSSHFPCSGLLVLTLSSVYFFEALPDKFKANKLNLPGIFYSMRFEPQTRLLYVMTKPSPQSKHLICELRKINVATDSEPDYRVTCNTLFIHNRGGSFTERSFVRGSIFPNPNQSGQILLVFDRGSGKTDHQVPVVPIDKIDEPTQVIRTHNGHCVVDIQPLFNTSSASDGMTYSPSQLLFLRETDLLVYNWNFD